MPFRWPTALVLVFAKCWPTILNAQPLAIEGQKKGGRTIFGSRRLLDVGNRRGDLDGDNVAGLVWVPEFRYGLRILPEFPSYIYATCSTPHVTRVERMAWHPRSHKHWRKRCTEEMGVYMCAARTH
jgi:hypothetical protein